VYASATADVTCVVVGGHVGGGGVSNCTSTGNIFSETFENETNYDNSNWAATETGADASVDPNAALPDAGFGSGSECLYTETIGDQYDEAYVTNDTDIADSTDPVYFRAWFRFTGPTNYADTEKNHIVRLQGDSTANLFLLYNTDHFEIYWRCYNEDPYEFRDTDPYTVTADTNYYIEYYSEEETGMTFKVNGNIVHSNCCSDPRLSIDSVRIGVGVDDGSYFEVGIYWDCVDISNSGFLGQ